MVIVGTAVPRLVLAVGLFVEELKILKSLTPAPLLLRSPLTIATPKDHSVQRRQFLRGK